MLAQILCHRLEMAVEKARESFAFRAIHRRNRRAYQQPMSVSFLPENGRYRRSGLCDRRGVADEIR
jgi:hypothetical protein